ncbi:minor capsid protein [Clostridium tertium]|uniref:minor capsid protein n=1 Tax=Clostridium tertium TaxID=1559 RepID=UPI003DA5C2B5
MKMNKEELFIESLYKLAEKQLKNIYKHKRLNRDMLLQEIANILLTYTIANDVMVMDRVTIDKEYKKMYKLIIDISKGEAASQEKIIEELLSTVVKETFSFYSYNKGLKDVKKIIESNFKGKHFSKRVWSNEKEVANHLHRKVQDFLKGKVNVNQIRKDIEKTFNMSAYNSKRLVETEVSRVSSNAFDRYCEETGVKKVRYNATLDSKLCDDCGKYHDKVFDIKDKLETPRHPCCRCFYTIEE